MEALMTPVVYNKYFTENPASVARDMKCKAFCYNVLEKITRIAGYVIMGGVFAVSFGLGASVTWLPTALFVGVLLLPVLGIVYYRYLQPKSVEFTAKRDAAVRIGQIYEELQRLNDAEILQRVEQAGIAGNQLPMQTFQQMNPQRPLQALLPVLARLLYWVEFNRISNEKVTQEIHAQRPDSAEVLDYRRHAYYRLEFEAIPAALNGTVMMQILLQPTLQASSIFDFGALHAKAFDQRLFDVSLEHKNDYFESKVANCASLSFNEVIKTNFTSLTPAEIHKKLIK